MYYPTQDETMVSTSDLRTLRPCNQRTDAQHELLAGIIGVAVDTNSEGLVGRCKVRVAIVTDGGQVVASYAVPSNSDPDMWYVLARTDKGGLFCPCAGFDYRGKCSHLEACEETPAPAFASFRKGDPVYGQNPRNGRKEFGKVAALHGDRLTIATEVDGRRTGHASYALENVARWERPADRAAQIPPRWAVGGDADDLFDAA